MARKQGTEGMRHTQQPKVKEHLVSLEVEKAVMPPLFLGDPAQNVRWTRDDINV